MYRKIRVEKRIPGGSLWQRFHGYRLGDVHGFARVYLPVGTPWWNPLGGWVTRTPGISLYATGRPFVISCSGLAGDRRFSIDIVRGPATPFHHGAGRRAPRARGGRGGTHRRG